MRPDDATPADEESLAITRMLAATIAWLIGVAAAVAENGAAADMQNERRGQRMDSGGLSGNARGSSLGMTRMRRTWRFPGNNVGVILGPKTRGGVAGYKLISP